jgi:L-rhamnose mutarotase
LHSKNNIKEGAIFLDPPEIEDTMWVEFEYAGMQAAAIQEWDNSWFIYTEDEQQWREERKEVIDELLRNSNVTKRGKATELSEQAHELVKRRGEQLEAQQEIPW